MAAGRAPGGAGHGRVMAPRGEGGLRSACHLPRRGPATCPLLHVWQLGSARVHSPAAPHPNCPPLCPTTPAPASLSLCCQAVEAKEGLPVSPENYTTGTVSYQSLFGYYRRLAGMTVRTARWPLPASRWQHCSPRPARFRAAAGWRDRAAGMHHARRLPPNQPTTANRCPSRAGHRQHGAGRVRRGLRPARGAGAAAPPLGAG